MRKIFLMKSCHHGDVSNKIYIFKIFHKKINWCLTIRQLLLLSQIISINCFSQVDCLPVYYSYYLRSYPADALCYLNFFDLITFIVLKCLLLQKFHWKDMNMDSQTFELIIWPLVWPISKILFRLSIFSRRMYCSSRSPIHCRKGFGCIR